MEGGKTFQTSFGRDFSYQSRIDSYGTKGNSNSGGSESSGNNYF